MNLRAKLTLGYVLLAVAMVFIISMVSLGNTIQQQFEANLERAQILEMVATNYVKQTLNSQLTVPLREALRDPGLADHLLMLLTNARAILEIAVVDPNTNQILADSDPSRIGAISGPYPDFHRVIEDTGWAPKLKLLFAHDPNFFQIE